MYTPSIGKIVAGRYELVQPLKTGGMGALWVARPLEVDRLVAVKFIAAALAEADVAKARFRREARAAARVRSTHVVQVFDYGVDEASDSLYLVMELLTGEDLGARLDRCERLSVQAAATIAIQAAAGLASVHDVGIVHRDVKPSNLFLVSDRDGGETVKLVDFGIAKALAEESTVFDATEPGEVLGSPEFMSPEQARGELVDGRSDLWSLALVLYRAVTGRAAFGTGAVSAVLAILGDEAPPPPSAHVPELPQPLDRFFERALARNPDRRFSSASEFAAALASITGVSAAEVPPSSSSPSARSLAATASGAPGPSSARSSTIIPAGTGARHDRSVLPETFTRCTKPDAGAQTWVSPRAGNGGKKKG